MGRKDDKFNLPPMPSRPRDGHKGTFGRVLVVGGSRGMIGAPAFAGTAALRMGTGVVQIAVPASVLSECLVMTPEMIGMKSDRAADVVKSGREADAIVIGPGLGHARSAKALIKRILGLEKRIVIDADALSVLALAKRWPAAFRSEAVLTPHPGEMAKMLGLKRIPSDRKSRIAIARRVANQFEQVVVLKGSATIVTDGVRVFVNNSGDTSLAKAGTGDILSGMIASLLARKMPRFEAACLAVHLHGIAGELAGKKIGPQSVLARDVIHEISNAIKKFSLRRSPRRQSIK